MDTKKLRQKILDLAIRGKLVPQDPNDEPASVLLERIRAEKQQLIKEGKIKAPKGYKACDTSHYEKIEGPFEIPESWEWVKISDIADVARGGSPRPIDAYLTNDTDGINWIKIGDAEKGGKYINSTQQKIKPDGLKKSRLVHKGDFLLTNSMSFGRPYILNVDGCIHDGWLVISPIGNGITKDYFYHLLSSGFAYEQFSEQASGAVVSNLNKDKVADSLFPLPPINEQHKIVESIENWIRFVDDIENSSENLGQHIEHFKSKVLSLAISGKLVPQNPTDEPAIELLKRINPGFKPCDNSQYPYDIPGSWQFAALGEVTSFLSRGKSPKYSEERKYPVFAQKCNQWEGITLEKVQFLEPSTLQKWPDEYKLQDGDVLINSTGTGTLGRTGIFYKNILGGYPFILPDSHVTVVRGNKEILSQEYLFLISRSLYMQKWMIDNMVGSTNQKELYPKALGGFMLAIPPRAEQDRIVSYVKRVIDKVESLVQNI